MAWFDDETKPKIGTRAYAQDHPGGYSEYGPGEPPNSASWRWRANKQYYSGGEYYSPEYDIIFYPMHIGGNKDPSARVATNAGPTDSKDIRFRCWLTKFQDNFTSDWNSEHVYGRMDPIETFKGTKRIINLGFDVMASTVFEAEQNQKMISALIRGLYPSYKTETVRAGSWSSTVGILQTAPVWKIKLANLIQDSSLSPAVSAREQGLTGRIAGISYVPNLDEGIFTGDLLEQFGKIYPQSVSMDITFHVWHTHEVGYTVSHTARSGFNQFPYGKSKSDSSPGGNAQGSDGSGAPTDTDTGAADGGEELTAVEGEVAVSPAEEVADDVAAAEEDSANGDDGPPPGDLVLN